MKAQAAYLLQWTMIKWLKEYGVSRYDFNPDLNPGIYQFKRGLSGDDVLYMGPWSAAIGLQVGRFAAAVSIAGPKARSAFRRLRGHI